MNRNIRVDRYYGGYYKIDGPYFSFNVLSYEGREEDFVKDIKREISFIRNIKNI